MSNAIESMEVLHFSPIVLSPLFGAFFESIGPKANSLLLGYLVLPLVLPQDSRTFLKNANMRSSLRTFANDRTRIFGLPERVARYRQLTADAIQYGIDVGSYTVSGDLEVSVGAGEPLNVALSPDLSRASSRLGKLFQPMEVPAIYRTLGVKRL